jgi:hypothetical protein
MADLELLSTKHALSLTDQPHLADMYQALADESTPVTFVVGAGFSMDAGLPSWSQLIGRMAAEIDDVDGIDIAGLIASDTDNLMRKAEQVVNIARQTLGYDDTQAIVRKCLYKGYPKTDPGALSSGLAQLMAVLKGRASVITTNFDDVLDTAMTKHAPGTKSKTYSMKALGKWLDAVRPSDPQIPILHIHGRLGRSKRDTFGDLVLTETEFLRSATTVQGVIEEALKRSTVIFLGLSMTDPNIVGPLWHAKGRTHKCFALSVPGSNARGQTIEQERVYAIRKSTYFEEELGLQPIFLKSYSQLYQVLQECRVANENISDYRSLDPLVSKAYGNRFNQLLGRSYSNVGRTFNGERVSEKNDERLSKQLAAGVQADSEIRKLLASFQKDPKTTKKLNEVRKQFDVSDAKGEEKFWLSLWMRNPSSTDQLPHSLRWLGSSIGWYNFESNLPNQSVEIEPRSRHSEALALVKGKGQLWNVHSVDSMAQWNSVGSAMIRVREMVGRTEIHTPVGVISLHSDWHYVGSTQKPGDLVTTVSILTALDTTQSRKLFIALENYGREILESRI